MKRLAVLAALFLVSGCKKNAPTVETTTTATPSAPAAPEHVAASPAAPLPSTSPLAFVTPNDPEVIDTLRRATPRLKRCWQEAMTHTRSPHGKIVLQLTIARDGRVRGIEKTSSTIGDPEIDDCVTNAVRGLRFPVSADERHVTFPLALESLDPR